MWVIVRDGIVPYVSEGARLIWMPYCAMIESSRCWTSFRTITALDPMLSMVIPFFWYRSIRFCVIVARPSSVAGARSDPHPVLAPAMWVVPDVDDVIPVDCRRTVAVFADAASNAVAPEGAWTADREVADGDARRLCDPSNRFEIG